MPITWRSRERYACSNCNASHSKCTKDVNKDGQPKDCENCTLKHLQCKYPHWARNIPEDLEYPAPANDPPVGNQYTPVVAVPGSSSGHHPAAVPLPQDSVNVFDVAHTGTEGVDVVYTDANYYLGTGVHVVGGAHLPDDDRRHSEYASGRSLSMDSLNGQSQNLAAVVTVVEARPPCLCFDTYPYRCEAHDLDDFFFTPVQWQQ